MKIFKTKRGYIHFNIKGLVRLIAGYLTIPLEIIMFHIFKPKTYFEYIRRGQIFATIRGYLAFELDYFPIKKYGSYRDPYRFASVYSDKPNHLIFDNGDIKPVNLQEEIGGLFRYSKQILKNTKLSNLIYEDR